MIHFREAELLFQASAVRYGRIPHEDLRRLCSDAANVTRAAEKIEPTPPVEAVLKEWVGKLEETKEKWREERV